jgi:hypothetical protein
VAPGGVNADSTAAAAGLAPADARPIAPVAMVKANVPNTSLLPVTIFMPSSRVYCFSGDGHRGLLGPLNLFCEINHASRLEKSGRPLKIYTPRARINPTFSGSTGSNVMVWF